jgi:hypothetical protein
MTRDESVASSLRDLEMLENDRLDREKRDREAREAREAARARDDAARIAVERREAATAKHEAERRAQALEAEEEARREAMSRAAVEQARIAVEARTRAEEAELERRHEIELARIRAEGRPSSGAGMIVGSAFFGGAIAFGIAFGIYYGSLRPTAIRSATALESALAEANTKTLALEREGIDRDRQIAVLERSLDTARAEIIRLSTHPPPRSGAGGSPTMHHPVPDLTTNPPTPFGHVCAGKGDPLCPE